MEALTPSLFVEYLAFVVKRSFKSYFAPFSYTSDNQSESLFSSFLLEKKGYISNKKTYMSFVRDLTCENQSMISNYWRMASECHKKLRLTKEDLDIGKATNEELSNQFKEMVYSLNSHLFKYSEVNFDLLQRYFFGRSKSKPRICIKGHFKSEEEDKVITVFRDSTAEDSHITRLDSNTGFNYVVENGKYFLCNDIPKAVFNGKYLNPRINGGKVKKKSLLNFLTRDFIWDNLWVSGSENSKYKSTLIIPMTFWNNGSEHEKYLNESLEVLPNNKRTILGFLCLDHVDKNYFDKEVDVSIAYVIADYLAMILYSRLNFLELSATTNSIEKEVQKMQGWFDGEELIEDVLSRLSRSNKESVNNYSVDGIEASTRGENNLWELDDELFQFSKKIKLVDLEKLKA